MTPELARALFVWHRNRTTSEYRVGPHAKSLTLKILPAAKECPQVLLDFLIRKFGTEHLILTGSGWGVPENLLVSVVAQARAVLVNDRESKALEKVLGLVETLEAPKPEEPKASIDPPRILKRKGFERWILCDPSAVEAQLKLVPDTQRDRKRVLTALAARPVRYLPVTTPAHVRMALDLRRDFPNFSPVIEGLADSLSLRVRMRAALRLPPTLLMGAPGLGKTAFSKALAQRLGFEMSVRSLAEMSAAFVLIGGYPSWSEARPGLIATLLADMGDDLAPLLMLDELDKVRSSTNYPPDVALLGLLEAHTARAFREENLDLNLNLEPISYLLTGNRLETIRPEILSRLQKVEIRLPTPTEMKDIVRSVDKVLRKESPGLSSAFEPLTEKVMLSLSVGPPRGVRTILHGAYSRVARRDYQKAGKLVLTQADLGVEPEREELAAPHVQQVKPYIMPLLVLDPAAWWRVH